MLKTQYYIYRRKTKIIFVGAKRNIVFIGIKMVMPFEMVMNYKKKYKIFLKKTKMDTEKKKTDNYSHVFFSSFFFQNGYQKKKPDNY